jgi:hypothetical protein
MALRLGMLYDALRSAHGVDEEDARKAAEEVADYDARIGRVERDLTVLKWMVGTTITLQLITLAGMLGLVWRLVPIGRA